VSSFDSVAGWCAIPSLLTQAEVAEVYDHCQALRHLPEAERLVGDKPHAGTHHLVRLDKRMAIVADLLHRNDLVRVVGEIIDKSFEAIQVSYRCPQPGYGGQKLHADGLPKMHDGPDDLATAIVPLVEFTAENGATRVVPGSHRRVDLQRLSGQADRLAEEIHLTGPAGTAFVFSGHLLHSGTKNKSTNERPALQLQWSRSA